MLGIQDRQIGVRARLQGPSIFEFQNARRVRRAQFDQPLERNHPLMHESVDGQPNRSLETDNSKRSLIVFQVLFILMMRGVISCNRIDSAVAQSFQNGIYVLLISELRVSLAS